MTARIILTGLFVSTLGSLLWAAPQNGAAWIWSDNADPAPRNRFTYFRKVVALDALPADATLRMAADSNAHLWINGQIVRRKVARYHEPLITAEVIDAGPYLRPGKNVVVLLHHNWGDIITFQRSGNKHAGLWLAASWIKSDDSWRCITAPEFVPHGKQVVGVIGDQRIRYAQIVDGRKMLGGDINDAGFDDSVWKAVQIVNDGPWPVTPTDVETPGQRESAVTPPSVLAAGTVQGYAAAEQTAKAQARSSAIAQPVPEDSFVMANEIKAADCKADATETRAAAGLTGHGCWQVQAEAGATKYVTFDFQRPVHGYPFVEVDTQIEGAAIDFGYCEIARSQYDGTQHVRENGWINPAGVVGAGYGDRYITRKGKQRIELPDERTARWMTMHVHFPAAGQITVSAAGMVKSQYPIDPIGSFVCGNKQIQQIVDLCLTHAEVSMIDTYVDTPGREDGQWIEDARPRAVLADRWFGDDRLRKLMIRTLAQSQGKGGNLHPFAPSNFPAYPAAYDWSVQWVAMLHDQYMWSGNVDDVRPYFDNLVKYWDGALSHLQPDGLWVTPSVLADLRVGVHAKDGQSSGVVTPWMIERLRWSADIAEALGEAKQAAGWRATADKMAEAFKKYHVVPAREGVPAHVADVYDPKNDMPDRGYSQAGQTVAITSGLLAGDIARADVEYAFAPPCGSPPAGVTRWNNPTYGYRALRTMSDVGLTDRAVAHLIERYSPYLPANPRNATPPAMQGPFGGPLPEYWVSREDLNLKEGEKDTAQPADETGSHGWGSVPLLWLHDTLLGVRIVKPGGSEISIAPDAGGLPYVAGRTMTPKGPVWVYWDPQQWQLEVEIPAGVTADVAMPPVCKGKTTTVVQAAGQAKEKAPGTFTLTGAGRYALKVK
jgi:hypothetical protein